VHTAILAHRLHRRWKMGSSLHCRIRGSGWRVVPHFDIRQGVVVGGIPILFDGTLEMSLNLAGRVGSEVISHRNFKGRVNALRNTARRFLKSQSRLVCHGVGRWIEGTLPECLCNAINHERVYLTKHVVEPRTDSQPQPPGSISKSPSQAPLLATCSLTHYHARCPAKHIRREGFLPFPWATLLPARRGVNPY